jgi:uncharacterized protein YdcH (DUF465 family)
MLEGVDATLVEQVTRDNTEFRQLMEEHESYEVQLLSFNDLPYLTSDQEVERKRLQKLKLLGKDRMMAILDQYAAS